MALPTHNQFGSARLIPSERRGKQPPQMDGGYMKRVSFFLLAPVVALLAALSQPAPAIAATAASTNPLGLVVNSLTTSASSYQTGARVTITASVRAASSVAVPQLVAAVRGGSATFDFPTQWNVPLSTTAKTLTFSGTVGTAGTYTFYLAYYSGSAWTDLSPYPTFTVTSSTVRSGVYTGWPQSPTTLTAFGTFRNRGVAVAADYLDSSSWANIEGPSWWMDTYRGSTYANKLLIGVPMLPDNDLSTTLAAGAAGTYDVHFQRLAQNLVAAGLSNAIIRPGWEFNSPVNYRWSGVAEPANFAAYFRHVVTAMRSVNSGFTFDLCFTVAMDGTRLDVARAWPGDSYVDYIGMDLYDMYPGGGMTAAQRWNFFITAPGGLNYLKALAATHNKKMSFDEWALASPSWGGGGDDPAFIQNMYDWMHANPVDHETYNNVRYSFTNGKLDDGGYPQASAKYKALFGG
jgi:hypothetical protein